jgi:hypothetical protein
MIFHSVRKIIMFNTLFSPHKPSKPTRSNKPITCEGSYLPPPIPLEKSKFVGIVRDEHVLRLAVVVEHHLVSLSAKSRLLVAAKGSVGGVQVVAVHPHTTGLDGSRQAVQLMSISGEHTGAKTEAGVIGNLDRLLHRAEGGHRHHRAKDLLLEHAHLVVALENGGLDVESTLHSLVTVATGEDGGSFVLANLQVRLDLVILHLGGLGTNHGGGVQGVASLDRLDASNHLGHESVVDVGMHEDSGWASAYFTLVQGEHGSRLHAFVQELIILIHHGRGEDEGTLATELQADGDQVLGRSSHDGGTGSSRSSERKLGHAGGLGQGLAGLFAKASDNVDHTRRDNIGQQLHEHHDGGGGLLCRLDNDAVAGSQSGGNLPGSHQQGKVPGNDLADHAQGLVQADADSVLIVLRNGALIGANDTRKVAEMVNCQGQISGAGLTDGLAIVHSLSDCQQLQVGLDDIGDAQQQSTTDTPRITPAHTATET